MQSANTTTNDKTIKMETLLLFVIVTVCRLLLFPSCLLFVIVTVCWLLLSLFVGCWLLSNSLLLLSLFVGCYCHCLLVVVVVVVVVTVWLAEPCWPLR